MGRPAALLLLLLLRAAAACFDIPPAASAELDLTNRTASCPVLDWAPFASQRSLRLGHNGIGALQPAARAGEALEVLDMSHNELRELPPAFLSRARRLRELFLQHNRLRQLPAAFFANATALQRLRLDGNPLAALPAGALPAGLLLLAVPCRCEVVGSALDACACRPPACAPPVCRCFSDRGAFNLSDFHERQCRGGGAAAAGAGAAGGLLLLLLLVVAAGVMLRCRRKGAAATGWPKREPPAAPGQPRYVSRATEPEAAATGACLAPDYENVFVSPGGCSGAVRDGMPPAWQWARGSPQAPVDDDYFLESDSSHGDQPIYANTQTPATDDIYIVPDK
ncbi:leucine-rich repeat-containing protein 25 [Struthio camelus]|uniref:leucine-rich repeat-containing protein 25 n=1 Tax=Struthio camelus TaxID=8801 RepID=UPI0036040DE0